MGAMSRNKGRAGEQEVARLIRDHLGLDVRRNWQAQSAAGGADLTGVPGWAIEVKLQSRPKLPEWQCQALAQAEAAQAKPALWYRITGSRYWHVRVLASDALGEDVNGWVQMDALTWMNWIRERLAEAA